MSYFINDIEYIKEQLPTTHEILSYLANGYTHEEIRSILCMSKLSVRGRLHRAREKYGCRTDRQLLCKAVAAGVIDA